MYPRRVFHRTLPALSIRRLQGCWCSERHRSGAVMAPDAATVRFVWPAPLPVPMASRPGELCCLTGPLSADTLLTARSVHPAKSASAPSPEFCTTIKASLHTGKGTDPTIFHSAHAHRNPASAVTGYGHLTSAGQWPCSRLKGGQGARMRAPKP